MDSEVMLNGIGKDIGLSLTDAPQKTEMCIVVAIVRQFSA